MDEILQQDTRTRLAGITLLLPLVAAVMYGGMVAISAISLISIVLVVEFSRLLGRSVFSQIGIGMYLIAPPLVFWLTNTLPLAGAVLIIGMICILYYNSLLAAIYAGGLSFCFCSLVYLVNLVTIPTFSMQLLALGIVISAIDIGAYVVGRKIGGRKLVPKISPKKTVSGAVGGFIFGIIASIMIAPLFDIGFAVTLMLATVIAVVAQAGDLFESALKRQVNVKDSSEILPGHGGLLDRFDGYVFLVPLLAFLNYYMEMGA